MATTLRQYITQTEADTMVTGTADEADMNLAEQLIDAFVGRQQKHVPNEARGVSTAGGADILYDTSSDSVLDDMDDDYFKFCVIEIVGGTSSGDIKPVTASYKSAGAVTAGSNFTATPDTTSAYLIYQLGMFPRVKDVWIEDSTDTYYKSIPRDVKQATLYQLEYIDQKGSGFFLDSTEITSERLGDWSATYGSSISGIEKIIAPKARELLRQFINRTGRMVVDSRRW